MASLAALVAKAKSGKVSLRDLIADAEALQHAAQMKQAKASHKRVVAEDAMRKAGDLKQKLQDRDATPTAIAKADAVYQRAKARHDTAKADWRRLADAWEATRQVGRSIPALHGSGV